MPDFEKISVKTYDGYKSSETPRKVLLSGKEYPVSDVLDSSRVRRADGEGDEEHFRVNLKGYGEAKIVYHHSWDGWTLENKPAKKTLSQIFVESQENPR